MNNGDPGARAMAGVGGLLAKNAVSRSAPMSYNGQGLNGLTPTNSAETPRQQPANRHAVRPIAPATNNAGATASTVFSGAPLVSIAPATDPSKTPQHAPNDPL